MLIDKSKINNIKVGNIDENFDVVNDADWVVEAVVERIDTVSYTHLEPTRH